MFISWMLIMQSFKKSLIVEQFQGNYLKEFVFFVPVGMVTSLLEQGPKRSVRFIPFACSKRTNDDEEGDKW